MNAKDTAEITSVECEYRFRRWVIMGLAYATIYCYMEFYRPEILTLETSYDTLQPNAAMPIPDLQYDRKYDPNYIRTTTVIRDLRIGV
jgi:hypothetical protein